MRKRIITSIIAICAVLSLITACASKDNIELESSITESMETQSTSNLETPTETQAPINTLVKAETTVEMATQSPSPENKSILVDDILELDGVSDELKQVAEFLASNQEVHLATVGADGNPSIHTFLFCYFTNGRIYFLTSKAKPVYSELTSTETVEFIVTTKDNTKSLTVRGSVAYDETYELIDRALTLYPNIKKIYGSADNPDLTMFYIEHGRASIFEFSDERQGFILQHSW